MRNFQVIATLFLSTLCAITSQTQAQELSVVETLKQHQHWGLIQPGISCVEQYQFKPNGEVSIQSLQERVTGTYQYIISPNDFQLPAMVIHFETDNQKPDCAGSSVNQAGTSTTNFLKKGADQNIYFCHDASGKDCPVYIKPKD